MARSGARRTIARHCERLGNAPRRNGPRPRRTWRRKLKSLLAQASWRIRAPARDKFLAPANLCNFEKIPPTEIRRRAWNPSHVRHFDGPARRARGMDRRSIRSKPLASPRSRDVGPARHMDRLTGASYDPPKFGLVEMRHIFSEGEPYGADSLFQ